MQDLWDSLHGKAGLPIYDLFYIVGVSSVFPSFSSKVLRVCGQASSAPSQFPDALTNITKGGNGPRQAANQAKVAASDVASKADNAATSAKQGAKNAASNAKNAAPDLSQLPDVDGFVDKLSGKVRAAFSFGMYNCLWYLGEACSSIRLCAARLSSDAAAEVPIGQRSSSLGSTSPWRWPVTSLLVITTTDITLVRKCKLSLLSTFLIWSCS